MQPGVVQDDLNRAAAAHGLLLRRRTPRRRDRATLGGMIGSNSAGAHSVALRDDDRPRARARGRAGRRLARPLRTAGRRMRARGLRATRSTARSIASCRGSLTHAARRSPATIRRTRGLPAATGSTARRAPFDLAKFVVGSEGTLASSPRRRSTSSRSRARRTFAVGHFSSVPDGDRGHGDALALGAAAVELIDDPRLDQSSTAGFDRRRRAEALLFVTFFGDTEAEARARLDALERSGARTAMAIASRRARVRGRAGKR